MRAYRSGRSGSRGPGELGSSCSARVLYGEHTRASSVRLQWRKLVELYKKRDSRYYWYDFRLCGRRYRCSTKETKKKRAEKIAALRLSQAMGGSGSLDRKAPSLQEFSTRFLSWVESATLAGKSKKYYRNGWRLLSKTKIVSVRLDHIAKDDVAGLSFSGSPANADRAHYCPKSRRVRTPQSPGWRRSASFHLVSSAFGEKAKCSLDLRTQWLELWPTPSPKHRRNTGLESFGFEFTRPERLN